MQNNKTKKKTISINFAYIFFFIQVTIICYICIFFVEATMIILCFMHSWASKLSTINQNTITNLSYFQNLIFYPTFVMPQCEQVILSHLVFYPTKLFFYFYCITLRIKIKLTNSINHYLMTHVLIFKASSIHQLHYA